MKRSLLIILSVLIWVIGTGLGGGPLEEAPKPKISFTVTIIDDQGISTKLKDITLDGRVYFTGNRGRGIVTIPFEKVKKVNFIGESRNGKKDAQVTLREGESIGITFDDEAILYGVTQFGTYRILIKNVKEILFE